MEQKDKASTVNQRMRRMSLSIGALCMEMENRGRLCRYCEVAAAFHGEPGWSAEAMRAILKTLDELEEGKSDGQRGH